MIKTPEMLEATHKRHMENWREEELVRPDAEKLRDCKNRFQGEHLTKPFSRFPGIEKIA